MVVLDEAPPHVLFGGVSADAWRWLHLEGPGRCPFLDRYIPSLPGDREFEARYVGASGTQALSLGFDAYDLVRDIFARYAGPLTPESRVLDFGCGWGRVLRFFHKDVAPENLIGMDRDPAAVTTCERTNRWARFLLCDPLPPSPLEDKSCDLVYAISVFSHLPEQTHERWLMELERVLAPRGVLVLTTFHRDLLPHRSDGTSVPDDELQAWFSAYDRGDFCFRNLPGIPDAHFGDAFIPEQYVRERWARHFTVQDYQRAEKFGQNVIVCTTR